LIKRNRVLCHATLWIVLWSTCVYSQSTAKREPAVLIEQFTFLIEDFKIDHQGENNNLNITIRYRYKTGITKPEYPDFTVVARDIETLLANYPNDEDYWEILNNKITSMVLEKYPAIAKITSQLQVSPSPKNHYLRSSIVTRERKSLNKPRR
jgi:hypothetical protein